MRVRAMQARDFIFCAAPASPTRSLAKELATLRRKSERDRGELTTVHLLSNMIHALKDCVSALRERKHDALLNEILIIKLWACHPVGAALGQVTGPAMLSAVWI